MASKNNRCNLPSAAAPAATSVDDLVRMASNMRINTPGPRSAFESGTAPGEYNQSIRCTEQPVGKLIEYKKGEAVYVIVAHGEIIGNSVIERKREEFENIRFGVLVGEGALLASGMGETLQLAAQRHIEGIVNGNIRVFQRYPWSKKPITKDSNAYFPNLLFREGWNWNEGKSFVAAIGRIIPSRQQVLGSGGAASIPVAVTQPLSMSSQPLTAIPVAVQVQTPPAGSAAAARMATPAAAAAAAGAVQFFQLTRRFPDGSLYPFNLEHMYPVDGKNSSINPGQDQFVTLESLLHTITKDVNKLNTYRAYGDKITRINIVFASCLANLHPSIYQLWTGQDSRVSIVTGGARKKNRKKRKQRRYIRKKIKTRKKRTQRKKRKTNKKRKINKKRKTNKKRKNKQQ